MNHTRKSFGVNSLPNGEEFYRACLRWHLSVDMTPEEVHEKGIQEVERISGKMKNVRTFDFTFCTVNTLRYLPSAVA